MNRPEFGKLPSGERLERIQASQNYKNGAFKNLNATQQITAEGGSLKIWSDFRKAKNRRPADIIPSVKTDLKRLSVDQNVLVWFGHSSYFMQIDGKKFLVDPVFCGHASPFPFMMKSFKGTDIYSSEDMPQIDYLIITHDHWDHLDYKTVKSLKPKVGNVITGLGTGAHLEHWGYEPTMIFENDWGDSLKLEDGFEVYTTTARHFSGRSTKPNQTLWVSFVLKTPSKRIFIGGDSGYDNHFKMIGEQFGPFDLAIIENGQYNKNWKFIHSMPEEVLMAGADLKAGRLLPVHSSKFSLSTHSWDEPLKRITDANKNTGLNIATPMIGEVVDLNNTNQEFKCWWVEIN